MIGAGQALRAGGRSAARAPEILALRMVVELFAGLAGAAPVALLALGVAAHLAPGSAIFLAELSRPLARTVVGLGDPVWLLPLGGLAILAFLAATLVRLLFLGGAVAALAEDVTGKERPTVARFATLAADRFERMVLFVPVALAGALAVTLWCGGVAGAGLLIFGSQPSILAAVAAALGLTLAVVAMFVAGIVGRLAIVRIALAGDGPGLALWNAFAILWRAPLSVVGVLAFLGLADLAASSFGLVSFVAPGDGPAAAALGVGVFIVSGLLQLALGSFLELWRYGALSAIAASVEGLLPEAPPTPEPPPPAPALDAVLVVDALEIPPPGEPERSP